MKLGWTTLLFVGFGGAVPADDTFGDGNAPGRAPEAKAASSGIGVTHPGTLGPLPERVRESLDTGRTGLWSAQSGETLRTVIQRWTEGAGWTLVWATGPAQDVVFEADVEFPLGTSLREALKAVFASLARGDVAVKACEYQNRTLRVVAYGARCD